MNLGIIWGSIGDYFIYNFILFSIFRYIYHIYIYISSSCARGAFLTDSASFGLTVIGTTHHRVDSYFLHLTIHFYLVQLTLSPDNSYLRGVVLI